jgi:hypothetical protein
LITRMGHAKKIFFYCVQTCPSVSNRVQSLHSGAKAHQRLVASSPILQMSKSIRFRIKLRRDESGGVCTQQGCLAQSAGKFIAFARGELARRVRDRCKKRWGGQRFGSVRQMLNVAL